MLQDVRERQTSAQHLAEAADQARGGERGAADAEEIILGPDWREPQHFLPQRRNPGLDAGPRSHERSGVPRSAATRRPGGVHRKKQRSAVTPYIGNRLERPGPRDRLVKSFVIGASCVIERHYGGDTARRCRRHACRGFGIELEKEFRATPTTGAHRQRFQKIRGGAVARGRHEGEAQRRESTLARHRRQRGDDLLLDAAPEHAARQHEPFDLQGAVFDLRERKADQPIVAEPVAHPHDECRGIIGRARAQRFRRQPACRRIELVGARSELCGPCDVGFLQRLDVDLELQGGEKGVKITACRQRRGASEILPVHPGAATILGTRGAKIEPP